MSGYRVQMGKLFQSSWSAFWATSFTLDPLPFEEVWLPRLGDPPLNATLLVDAGRLEDALGHLAPDRLARLRRMNRDYLVRGIHVPGGAFHPKTYLFGNPRRGILAVGSGNLSLHGLERGHEVFACFPSDEPEGLAVLRGWRRWMEAVVQRWGDPVVAERWFDLQRRLNWLPGAPAPSSWVHNLERPLLEQFLAGVTAPTDAVHALAPFFDREATVLRKVVAGTRPRELHLYLGDRTSVAGEHLAAVLAEAATLGEVHTWAFEPATYVHAKLLGVVRGDRLRLLSGSPNLTRHALLGSVDEGATNVEVGLISELPATAVAEVFAPPDLSNRPMTDEALADLRHRPIIVAPAPPLRLLGAAESPEGRVQVRLQGAVSTDGLHLTNGSARVALRELRTVGPLDLGEGRVVWLVSGDGQALSNHLAVDDPEALRQRLQATGGMRERPLGLDAEEDVGALGRLMLEIFRKRVFELAEAPTGRPAPPTHGGRDEEDDAADDEDERRIREDPRAIHYRAQTWWREAGDDDDLDGWLNGLLAGLPRPTPRPTPVPPPRTQPPPPGANAVAGANDADPTVRRPRGRRTAVRYLRVIDGWTRTITSPRTRWLKPYAPVVHYVDGIRMLATGWRSGELPPEQAAVRLRVLLESFVRGDSAEGFLGGLDDAERAAMLAELPPEARAVTAALVYVALRQVQPNSEVVPAAWYAWQPALRPALELGVVQVGSASGPLAAILMGAPNTSLPSTSMENCLRTAATYLDDTHWRKRVRERLGLEVQFQEPPKPEQPLVLDVTLPAAWADALAEPALVEVVRQAFAQRGERRLLLRVKRPDGQECLRLALLPGTPPAGRYAGRNCDGSEPLSQALLDRLVAHGQGWAPVLALEQTSLPRSA